MLTIRRDPIPARLRHHAPTIAIAVVAAIAAVAAGPAVSAAPLVTVGAAATVAIWYVVLLHPPLAAYALLAATPLVVGIDRGAVVPVLRPSELLLAVLLVPVLGHLLWSYVAGAPLAVRFRPLDGAIVALAVLSSVVPVLWLLARDQALTTDDLLYSVALWKYFVVYLLIRLSVTSERHVRTCLAVLLVAAGIVSAVAVLQSLGLFGVASLLATHWAPQDVSSALESGRGTSTLASSISVGDVMAYSTALALAWAIKEPHLRRVLLPAVVLFILGAFASGQFSGVLALVIAVVATGWVTRTLRSVVRYAVPVLGLAGLALAPVVMQRLAGFRSGSLPVSWTGRWENLTTFFWPELFRGFNYLLGVRPSARIVDPNDIFGFVWIESGYTWLLWNGGLPLLAAFVAFLVVGRRQAFDAVQYGPGTVSVAGVASVAMLVVVAIMMVLDPHLTLRGSADMAFALLALIVPISASWSTEDAQ